MMDCSEFRFRDLSSKSDAVQAIRATTRQFATSNELTVRVVSTPSDIPNVPIGQGFKYGGNSGSLGDAKCWMEEGHTVQVVLVEELDSVMGYGIALRETGEEKTEIKIIDVARGLRRWSGRFAEIELEGERFQVGAAHVLVLTLLENIKGPMETDATNPASRYVFKSLGFVHDDTTSNPCILKFG